MVVCTPKAKFAVYRHFEFKGTLVALDVDIRKFRFFKLRNIKSILAAKRSIKAILQDSKYVSCNFYSDFRENLILFALSRSARAAPASKRDNLFFKTVWKGFGFLLTRPVAISDDCISFYKIVDKVLEDLGLITNGSESPNRYFVPKTIGIHPFAASPSRQMALHTLAGLIQTLLEREYRVTVFCGSPGERASLDSLGSLGSKIEVFVGSIDEFLARIASLDLIITMDSFAAHAGHSKGVPSIFISSSNDYRLWKPPDAMLLINRNSTCKIQPCLNRTPCLGKPWEFVCVKSMSAEQIIELVEAERVRE